MGSRVWMLRGGSGYGHGGWVRGQVIEAPLVLRAQGAPPYLFVMAAGQTYHERDGRVAGVGAERGWAYWALCREATAREARPLVERRLCEQAAGARSSQDTAAVLVQLAVHAAHPAGGRRP